MENADFFRVPRNKWARRVKPELKSKGSHKFLDLLTSMTIGFSESPERVGWLDVSIPTHKTLFCVKSITYLNIVWDVNLKVISSFH